MTSSELKHQADAGVGAGNTGVPEQWDVRAGMVPPTGGHANNIFRRLMEGLKIEQPKAHRPMVGLSMV